MIKRLLVSIAACAIIILNLMLAGAASAKPSPPPWMPMLQVADASSALNQDLITQLEMEILPQLETIFTPAQREQFKTSVANGTSFRKAFKSLMLTPEQKTQLKTLLKSIAKKDALAALTPDQKKQLFLKKKELFMPTADEIADRINAGMKNKGIALPEGVQEKIDAGIQKKAASIPTSEDITEAIKAGMNLPKEKGQD